MAKLYSKGGTLTPDESLADEAPETLLSLIEAFLSDCHRPAALEWGENPIALLPGKYALQIQSGRLSIEIWDENRSISRRILTLQRRSTGILDCSIQRFGGKPGRLSFLDLSRPQTAHRSLTAVRHTFAERFRQMMTRQFPGWRIDALTASQDLRRSLSRVYPRAHLSRGSQVVAAVACANPADEPHLLAFALIWHRYLQKTAVAGHRVSLALFLPVGAGNITAHRLRWLQTSQLQPDLYLYNEHGAAGQVDPQDLGNLDTRVTSQYAPSGEFASAQSSVPADCPPERWLETVVRANITQIDPALLTHPVHSQVLTFAAGDRDLIDLLAVSNTGRLCVIELKASEDLQLPLQALDYWMRIAWHAKRGELNQLFPKVSIQACPPKLILLAPAMAFHSSNADIISYFSREIEVERVGVNTDWRHQLRVVLRLAGSALPASH